MLKRKEKALAAEFKEQAEEIKARQTEQLERIAEEAFAQWLRSYEDHERVTTETGRVKATDSGIVIPLPDKETVVREGQSGNPALLAQAMKALADARAIWGLGSAEEDLGGGNRRGAEGLRGVRPGGAYLSFVACVRLGGQRWEISRRGTICEHGLCTDQAEHHLRAFSGGGRLFLCEGCLNELREGGLIDPSHERKPPLLPLRQRV
jgi:hypothetical protein